MKIKLETKTIKELVNGFEDKGDEGVFGYGGKLNIRPAYQREFVYKIPQQQAVINSILKDFPLNVMYWIKNKNETYELLDGQQRTLSICSFVNGEFFVNVKGSPRDYNSLGDEYRKKFDNYKLQIYVCEDGTKEEQLDWFKTINIAGEKLVAQEIRNAIYSGPWVTAVKKKFSKKDEYLRKEKSENNERYGEKYLSGHWNRQDYLETILKWIFPVYEKKSIEEYMASRQKETSAEQEWQYYQEVIAWVDRTFTTYRDIMKGVPWGDLYRNYGNKRLSADALEKRIKELIADPEVDNKKGVYDYVLSGDERKLNLRAFDDKTAQEAYERQGGICIKCGKQFKFKEMQADHITPWSKGGKTIADNCQMLCADCNRRKSNK